MRYPHHDGIGKRIKKQLVVLGFKTPAGGPDMGRFIRERGYDGRYFYRWANKDVTPAEPYLSRLCRDLSVSPAWLVFGEAGSVKPKKPPAAGYYVKRALAWVRWTPYRRRSPCLHPQVALAA